MNLSKRVLSAALAIALAASITLSGCSLIPGSTSSGTPSASTNDHKEAVTQAWDILFKDYVEPDKLDSAALSSAAIRGIVEELNDPYTVYLDPVSYQLTQSSFQGTFFGIGATVAMRNGQVIIIAPMPGSPAEKAGIQSGDVILAVNGISTANMSVEEVVLHVRGKEGTPVTLTVQHPGQSAPVDITLVRAQVNVPTVEHEMRGDIGYIRIFEFSATTDTDFTTALRDIIQKGAKGIIIDERSNPGGLADTVAAIVSHFVTQGVVLYVVDNAGHETKYPVRQTPVTTDLPLVVLTDNFSASGSEVLAGAIQDYKRGIVAGTTTFGKGSANVLNELKDGSGLYVTIARWETPNRRRIEGKGITPDYPLTLTGDDLVQWAIDYLHSKTPAGMASIGGQELAAAVPEAAGSGSGGGSFLWNFSAPSRWSM